MYLLFYQPVFADAVVFRLRARLVCRNNSAHFPVLLQLPFYFTLVKKYPVTAYIYIVLSGGTPGSASNLYSVYSAFAKTPALVIE